MCGSILFVGVPCRGVSRVIVLEPVQVLSYFGLASLAMDVVLNGEEASIYGIGVSLW